MPWQRCALPRELLPKIERNDQRRLYALWCDVLPVMAGLQLRGQAQQFRQVRTRLGLVRDFDVQGEGYLRGEAQNIAVQGSAAEVLMSALRRLPQALTGTGAAFYHTVHDEITLQVPLDQAKTAAQALQDAMVQGFLDVFPDAAEVVAVPEVKQGGSWAAVH